MPCPTSPNQIAIDESHFWETDGIQWNTHRIGWTIAGGCAALTTIISAITVLQHCRSYTVPAEQRQILRILYMPPVYAIISFFSYRFFRNYTYYSFIEVGKRRPYYCRSTFLTLLIIEFVAATASGHSTDRALERKDKMPLPMPFCCWRYRPTKAYFMYTVKWSVLQYVIIRPLVSIAGIICERLDILCDSDGYSWRYASVYLAVIDFISIRHVCACFCAISDIALYGLLIFYGLMHEELEGRRPLAKFLAIKLIVMFTFYQSFVVSGRAVDSNDYWTVVNIKDGLDALLICIEMVFFSAFMWWAYTPSEYTRKNGELKTSIWRPLRDSINYMDFVHEIWGSLRFFADYARGRPTAHGYGHRMLSQTDEQPRAMDFGQAFGVSPTAPVSPSSRFPTSDRYADPSHDENIMLAPYPFTTRA
ncbi:organic solute transporter Ostalpha-domain-containing protein [Pholiota molesta]|nr:organic solute transporter Ostalpha-domain-containing protein [Pholiota molesta]